MHSWNLQMRRLTDSLFPQNAPSRDLVLPSSTNSFGEGDALDAYHTISSLSFQHSGKFVLHFCNSPLFFVTLESLCPCCLSSTVVFFTELTSPKSESYKVSVSALTHRIRKATFSGCHIMRFKMSSIDLSSGCHSEKNSFRRGSYVRTAIW